MFIPTRPQARFGAQKAQAVRRIQAFPEACRTAKKPPVATPVLDESFHMTIIGHVKTITISYFKAHISEELKKVRKGARLLISDRDTPIAEVVPYRAVAEPVTIRAPRVTPFQVPRSRIRIEHDPLEYLSEDRGAR